MRKPLGKGEVESSILSHSTRKTKENKPQRHNVAADDRAGLGVNDSGTVARNWQSLFHAVDDAIPGDAFCVYRYFAPNDRLLYVGMTCDLWARHVQHARQPWMPYAVLMMAEVFKTRDAAAAAERHAIMRENPDFNSIRRAAWADASRPIAAVWGAIDEDYWTDVTVTPRPDWWRDGFTQAESHDKSTFWRAVMLDLPHDAYMRQAS
jgi:hypothetical protein